jgi:transcriptional regulator with XRE-family HTH domain
MPAKGQRQELGAFLRARRAALRPEDVGLAAGVNRRRTPGLRREELAQHAGMSVSWYTRLEQGKDVQLSPKALARVAEALQLSAAQREYVFTLARGDMLGVEPSLTQTISVTLQDVLDAQGDNPAYLIDARLNLLAWNQAAVGVFGFADDLAEAPAEERNLLWLIFTDDARGWLVDRERHARLLLAQFRDASRHVVNDPWLGRFVERLKQRSADPPRHRPRRDNPVRRNQHPLARLAQRRRHRRPHRLPGLRLEPHLQRMACRERSQIGPPPGRKPR